MVFVASALAVALLGFAQSGHALTLGELQGAAVLGRTLDVAVRVQSASGEDLATNCFSTELFHADTRQSAPRISVTVQPPDAALVRIQSAAVIDEPVVSFDLRFNCGSVTTRRYVLLADFAPVFASPAAVAAVAQPARAAAGPSVVAPEALPVVPAPAISTVAMPPGTANTGATAAKARPAVPAKAQKTVKTSPEVNQVIKPAPMARGKAILKLDPLDILSDRVDSVDSLMLFTPTADALLHAQQITTLKGDLQSMQAQAAKNDAQLLSLKAQLQLVQSQQVPVTWFYALLALMLICLAGIAWLVVQRRGPSSTQAPWHDSLQRVAEPVDQIAAQPQTLPETPAQSTAVVQDAAAAEPPRQPPPPAPMALADALTPTTWALSPVGVAPAADNRRSTTQLPAAEPALPDLGIDSIHSFSVEPILDIRQQAEFFVSLGQTERALDILKKQISSSADPNPFIYLDLLALFHSLGMKADFRDCRHLFNRHFAGDVPDFPAFHLEGNDLLAYANELAQLVKDWPSAKSLVLLDRWIFRSTQAQPQPTFELAAFRDLLMLHALAEAVATDLPWDTVSPSLGPDVVFGAKPDAAPPLMEADIASGGRFPQRARASSLPKEFQEQSVEVDFSNFDTGSASLDLELDSKLPSADLPRSRWPVSSKPN
ncbi:MAG: hypothetical protein IPN53_24480 [Comamonadaceae bacterium]|nr:hypothetical protein [Comamonadaceae bacterium]